MSLSQVFKDCAIVEGYCANSLRPTQNIRERYYGLLQESLWLHNFYPNDNMKF